MTQHEAATAPEVITGTMFLSDLNVQVLIDPGSTHSFISSATALCLRKESKTLSKNLAVHTPIGEIVSIRIVYKNCAIRVNGIEFLANLIVFLMLKLDVILGMDWLARHRAIVNCYTKEVVFDVPGQEKVVFCGNRQVVPNCLISAVNAFRMIQEGCPAYLAYVADSTKPETKINDIPVVCEYSDVFPDELPGLPPHRETEFEIDVMPDVLPISIQPYRMAPMELQELKK